MSKERKNCVHATQHQQKFRRSALRNLAPSRFCVEVIPREKFPACPCSPFRPLSVPSVFSAPSVSRLRALRQTHALKPGSKPPKNLRPFPSFLRKPHAISNISGRRLKNPRHFHCSTLFRF